MILYLSLFISSLLIASMTMFITWLFYLKTKNPGIVDIAWEVGFISIISSLFFASKYTFGLNQESLVLLAVIIWGLRLLYYLIVHRILKGVKEKRYEELQKQMNTNLNKKYFIHFQLQALIQAFIAMSFYPIFLNKSPSNPTFLFLGILIFLTGFVGEWISDYQLRYFKEANTGKKKVCDTGLWSLSRHPNLFFEFVIWIGIATISVSNWKDIYAYIGVAILFHVMHNITGPVTEKYSLKSRGKAFEAYKEKVPYFFPRILK